jgi:hypothetical protein
MKKKIKITCKDCKQDRFVATNGMLKKTYEKKVPRCHKCGFNKEKSCKTWFKKGHVPWSKGRVLKKMRNENSPHWKGDKVGYYALHDWVYKKKGKPKKCSNCGSREKVQWANKSFSYKRDLKDWIELCYWCHRKYDMENGWGRASQKFLSLRK